MTPFLLLAFDPGAVLSVRMRAESDHSFSVKVTRRVVSIRAATPDQGPAASHDLVAGLPPESAKGLAEFCRANVEKYELGSKGNVVGKMEDFSEHVLRVAARRATDRLQEHVQAHDVVRQVEQEEKGGEKQQHLGQLHLRSRVQAAGHSARCMLPSTSSWTP